MFRKLLTSLIGVSLLTGVALAQESRSELRVSSAFVSKYIWNAFDRVEDRGLDTGPLVQPKVEWRFAHSPLRVHVGGSFIMNDNSELHEANYGLSLVRSVGPLSTLSLGYNYYDDRVTQIAGVDVEDVDTHEVYGQLRLHNPVGADPSLAVKYEQPTLDGADSYYVVIGGLAFNVLPSISAPGVGVNVQLLTNVIYNSGVKVNNVDVVDRGIAAWQVGLAGSLSTPLGLVISPHVDYQITIKDAVNQENPFWAGVNVAFGF